MADTRSMEVEIIARETIKPSSPTPHHLRTFKFSLLDQNAPPVYSAALFFYPHCTSAGGPGNGAGKGGDSGRVVAEISQLLKASLSETLTRFYPVAGRIKDYLSVDCSDEGAEYLEARVNCPLSDVLDQPQSEDMKNFMASEPTAELGRPPLLVVQASFFTCGGMALGNWMSHKIFDGATIAAFLKAWASTALGSPDMVVPDFTAASSRFPPRDQSPITGSAFTRFMKIEQKVVARRFVFKASDIAALKAKAASTTVQNPTSVEAVSALLWKCAMNASRNRLGYPRPSLLIVPVNMRARLAPPLPQYSFGNVLEMLRVLADESEIDFRCLVCRLRKAKEELGSSSKEVQNLQLKEIDLYFLTSLRGFPFYEIDFGWGKPMLVIPGRFTAPNLIQLVGAKEGDGIEAWVSLIEEDMALFQSDPELQQLVSPILSAQ